MEGIEYDEDKGRYAFTDERTDGYEHAPLVGGLSEYRERRARVVLVRVVTEGMSRDRTASQIAGDILHALREPLE